jgi:hypothetical protein
MDIRELAIERLIAADPRQSIDQTLGLLMAHTHTSSAGLFITRGDVELLAGRGIDPVSLDRVRAAWAREGAHLRDGRPVFQGAWCLWPLESARGPLLAYLGAERPLRMPAVREAITALAGLFQTAVELEGFAARAPETAAAVIDSYLEATPAESVERRQLLALLNRSEWNLSRVARLLGVTRVTIYNRMARLGIDRLRIRKTEPRTT